MTEGVPIGDLRPLLENMTEGVPIGDLRPLLENTTEGVPIGDLRPLLIDWLTQWKNAASRTGSRMEFVYKNALKSLRAYDQPVKTAKECRQIKYFG